MVLQDKAYKYGENRVSVRIPNDLKDEIKVGDPCEVYIDREKKAVIFIFPESEIHNKKFDIVEQEE